MKLPTKRQSKGYDILIWIDEEGDVVCRAYTSAGTMFLKTMDSRYQPLDVLEIITHPEVFKKNIPPMLMVGSISPETKKVHRLITPGLQ